MVPLAFAGPTESRVTFAMMSIGMLSKRSGVHIETIRYYERVGVLPKAERAANGRRTYGEDDAGRLGLHPSRPRPSESLAERESRLYC